MKLLFVARHFTYFRNFDSVVAALAGRGHQVHLAADREESLGGRELVDRLAAEFPRHVTVGFAPARAEGSSRRLSSVLRHTLDYLRYAGPRYDATPKIRERAYERTPRLALMLGRLPCRDAVARGVDWLERAVPREPQIDAFVRAQAPDLLLLTPLIELGSPQVDYLRAARALGIRTALPVWSWDHLSSKALIRVVPDAVIVWNEAQRDEAARFHGITGDRVLVTGAQCFDRWFDRRPTRDREAFCRRVGLPPDRPFILYVCSSLFKNSPAEAPFVRDWVAALRGAPEARLRAAAVLVRPHPQRLEEWRTAALDFPDVAVWGSSPVDAESRADYFDSMYHAAAVVGLNTSALVEAAIVDRPVFTILTPAFRDNQEGTFHFHHLLEPGHGFVNAAGSLEAHAGQLAAMLAGQPVRSNRPFVERFIRPRGLDTAATPVFVETVERLAAAGPVAPLADAAAAAVLRPVIWLLALADRTPLLERLYWTPVRRREWADNVRAIRGKGDRRRAKRRDKFVRVARKLGQRVVVRAKTVAKQALIAGGLQKHP